MRKQEKVYELKLKTSIFDYNWLTVKGEILDTKPPTKKYLKLKQIISGSYFGIRYRNKKIEIFGRKISLWQERFFARINYTKKEIKKISEGNKGMLVPIDKFIYIRKVQDTV